MDAEADAVGFLSEFGSLFPSEPSPRSSQKGPKKNKIKEAAK